MANKKVQNSDLFAPDVFQPTQEQAESFLKVLQQIEQQQKELLKTSQEQAENNPFENNSKALKETEDGLKGVDEAQKNLAKIEKQRIKLNERLESIRKGEQDDILRTRELINRENKERRDNIKATLDQDDAFKRLTRETNKAQAEFKRLAADVNATTDEVDEAEKKFRELDDQLRAINDRARDGRRDVGRYQLAYEALKKDVNEADTELKEIIVTFGKNSKEAKKASRRLKGLSEQLKNIEDEAKQAREGITRLEKGFKDLNSTLGKLGFIAIFLKTFEILGDLFRQNTDGANDLEKAFNRIVVPLRVFINGVIELSQNAGTIFNNFLIEAEINFNNLAISALNVINVFGNYDDKINDLKKQNEDLAKSVNDVKNPFDTFFEDIEKGLETTDKLIDQTTRFTRQNAELERQIAELGKTQGEAQAQAEDATQSFERQLEGVQNLISVNEQINKAQNQILKNELELARLRFESNSQNVEAQAEFIKAQAAVIAAENEQQNERLQLERQRTEILRDQFEQELDILFDVSDRRKSINERIAADETQSFEARRNAVRQAQKDIESSYQAIEESFNNFIEGDAINLDELLSIQDTTEFEKRIDELRQQFNIDEITINRLREARIELDAATQDLIETERDLTASELDANEIREQTILTEEALSNIIEGRGTIEEETEKLTQKRLETDIKALEERLKLTKDNSAETLNIENELAQKRLELQQMRIDKETEAEKKGLEKRAELTEKAFEVVNGVFDKQNEARINRIDNLIDANQSNIESLQQAAEQNSENALENLAFERKQQAQLQRERQQEIRRQQRQELTLSAIQTFSSKVNQGKTSQQALSETVTDITVLRSLISNLPAFKSGKDVTGRGNIDSDGGFLSVVHPNEMILSEENRKAMINNPTTRGEVIDMYNLGAMALKTDLLNKQNQRINFTSLEAKMSDVEKAIMNKKTYLGSDVDTIQGLIKQYFEQGNRKETVTKKLNTGIW